MPDIYDFAGESIPFMPWAGMLVLIVTYVATGGAGLSSTVTLVSFASLALSV